jgi:hypothetical protein
MRDTAFFRSRFSRIPRSPSALIAAVLLLTLIIAMTLAWQAQRTARLHRATAERVLRDYATFASWELARVSTREISDALGAQLARLSSSCRSHGETRGLEQWLSAKDG